MSETTVIAHVDGVRLPGMRSDSLIGYLKAIGLLRLIATQREPSIRVSWSDAALVVHGMARDSLIDFFERDYRPTPALNPWNGGAGFDAKSRHQEAGKTLDRIAAMCGERWSPYRNALHVANDVIEHLGSTEEDRKATILTTLRSRYADEALPWIDAAVLFGGDEVKFPPLLGTGGNDGRLDFSINFAQRSIDVVGDKPLPNAVALLRDAIDGTSTTPLGKGSIGQFSLALAGGPNMTTGFSGGSLLNPWDFVLAIEGTMAFAGAVVRRFATGKNRIAAPFTFRSIAAGYAAASADEPSRGEIWLPCWSGEARYASVRTLLRNGRVELDAAERSSGREARIFGTTSASDSIAAVQAAQTLGVASGVESFSRIVVAQRNGLAFGATYAGRIVVADRPEIAALSRETRGWVQRARNDKDKLGAAARAALHAYDEGTVAYADRPEPRRLRDILLALAKLDAALATVCSELRPLPFLSAALYANLDQGDLDHRVARAITSLGYVHRKHRIRFLIAAIRPDAHSSTNDRYDRGVSPVWRSDVRDTLAQLFVRRVRDAAQQPDAIAEGFTATLRGRTGLSADDFADVLAGGCNWRYVKELVRAYSIIEPLHTFASSVDEAVASAFAVPAVFAAFKWLLDGVHTAADARTYLDPEAAVALGVGNCRRAFDSAYARLRNAGIDVRDFRRTSIDLETRRTFLGALLIPAAPGAIRRFRNETTLDRSHYLSAAKETP